jgi:hypothetical protein
VHDVGAGRAQPPGDAGDVAHVPPAPGGHGHLGPGVAQGRGQAAGVVGHPAAARVGLAGDEGDPHLDWISVSPFWIWMQVVIVICVLISMVIAVVRLV